MNKRTVDAYIEPIKVNSNILNYRMYMQYNGLDFCFLSNDSETANFASYFKRKMGHFTKETMLTDKYGIMTKNDNFDSVVAYITGIDNIDSSISSLIVTSMNLDIQSDLTVHIGEKDYPLVRDVDNKKYTYNDNLSKKGYDDDVLLNLSLEIDNLKSKLDVDNIESILDIDKSSTK